MKVLWTLNMQVLVLETLSSLSFSFEQVATESNLGVYMPRL
jgi:hypothetical protein